MPSREENDRDAKPKARDDRRKHGGTSTSSGSHKDRKLKVRVRRARDNNQPAAPGEFAGTEKTSRSSKKSSVDKSKH